jgi:uncharacterized protein YrzB (UPF0473 family)
MEHGRGDVQHAARRDGEQRLMPQEPTSYGPVRLSRLREQFGQEIELVSDDDSSESFRILAEYSLNGNDYAALQTPAMRKEDEIAFFRVSAEADGTLGLSTIDDEDEWEAAAEGYDELMFESGTKE